MLPAESWHLPLPPLPLQLTCHRPYMWTQNTSAKKPFGPSAQAQLAPTPEYHAYPGALRHGST
eukprot:3654242-Amphidinium_carterae.2